MPATMAFARKRKTSLTHAAQRKSLVQGILSVANGEGETPATDLKEGKKLPDYLPKVTYSFPECAYKPLPDPDKFYENNTYIMVNKHGTLFRFSESKSLFLLGRDNGIRKAAINLMIRPMFSHFIMMVILANCACMVPAEPPSWVEDYLEYVFTAIYCFEAALKIAGRGFVLHRFAYLRDPWNWLDFIVIVSALITELMKAIMPESMVGHFSVLRAFRVLRALKTMSVVPGLRGIVKALLRSIRALKDAVVLTMFCVSVFALVGYQLFSGTLRNKCVLEPGSLDHGPDALYSVDWEQPIFAANDNLIFLHSLNGCVDCFPTTTGHNTSEEQVYSGRNISLPFMPEPLYNTPCVSLLMDKRNLPEQRTNVHTEKFEWNENDKNVTLSLFRHLNGSETNESDPNSLEILPNSLDVLNISVSELSPTQTDGCSSVLDKCIVFKSFGVNVPFSSSLLHAASYLRQETMTNFSDFWKCEQSLNDPNLTTFGYTTEAYAKWTLENSTVTPNQICQAMIQAFSANISCLYEKLDIERDKPDSKNKIENHTCYFNNTWVKTLRFGEMEVPRWVTRKNIVYFKMTPVVTESWNHIIRNKSNKGNIRFRHKSFLIFEEFSRTEMKTNVEKKWDLDEKNYLMVATDLGQYFYLNSSNRPGMEPVYCNIGSESMCPAAYKCREAGMNPDFGYTNFDHFFWAFLTSFRLIAQDAWSRLYFLTLHTIGKTYVIFYIIVMFLGSYYLINLILAVVYMAYEEQQSVVEDDDSVTEEQAQRKVTEMSDGDSNSKEDTKSRNFLTSRPCIDLITTSLTSIPDTPSFRHRRSNSVWSRYGHKRPFSRFDAQSEVLYQRYTQKFGNGIPKKFSCDLGVADSRKKHSSRNNLQNSHISIPSVHFTSPNKCNNSETFPHWQTSRRTSEHNSNREYNKNDKQIKPLVMTPHNDASVSINIPNQSNDAQERWCQDEMDMTENSLNSTCFWSNAPKPVNKSLIHSQMNVLSVDFAHKKSPSECSLSSDSSSRHLDISLKCEPNSDQFAEDSTSSLAQHDSPARISRLSSNSGFLDAKEQIIEVEISPSTHRLSPYLLEQSKESGSLFSSTSSYSSKDQSQPLTPAKVLNFNSNSNTSQNICPPLQVPCLMVTSASSEQLASLPKRMSIKEEFSGINNNECDFHENEEVLQKSNCENLTPNMCHISLSSSNGVPQEEKENLLSTYWSSLNKNEYSLNELQRTIQVPNSNDAQHSTERTRCNGLQDSDTITSCNVTSAVTKQKSHTTEKNTKHWSRQMHRRMRRNLRKSKKCLMDVCCKWTCCPQFWQPFQIKIRALVLDPFMDLFITLCIFFNTVFMTIEYHPMDLSHQRMLDDANLGFTVVFCLEMMLKVIGLGPHTYFHEAWNVFDAVVVISSMLELLLQSIQGLSVLRAFRLLRILKLAKSWPTLNKLLRIIGQTLGKLWDLTLVFLLVLFIFAVVGMQLLRENYHNVYHENLPRWNFIDFPHAFMVVFRIQCGEWIENMFTCMNVASSGICIPLFILVYVIGNLVILNLFLALLLNSFSGDVLQRTSVERNSLVEAGHRILKWLRNIKASLKSSQVLMNCCNKIQLCLKDPTVTNSESHTNTDMAVPLPTEETMVTDEITAGSKMYHKWTPFQEQDEHSHFDKNEARPGSATEFCRAENNELKNGCQPYKFHENRKQRSKGNQSLCKKNEDHGEIGDGLHPNWQLQNRRETENCHRQLPLPQTKRRQEKKKRQGFLPASAFQWHCSQETLNTDDIEMTPLPVSKQHTFPDEDRPEHEILMQSKNFNSFMDRKTSMPKRTKSETCADVTVHHCMKKITLVPDEPKVHFAGRDGKSVKYIGPDETEVPLIRKASCHLPVNVMSDSSSVMNKSSINGGSFRRASETKSDHSSIDSDSHSSASINKDEKNKENKEEEIPDCFYPCWTNGSKEEYCWKIRQFFYKLSTHRYFDNIVIFFILLSSIALAFEDIHLKNRPVMLHVLDIMDTFFCIFFTFEMLIKWIGFGIRFYFTNAWCILDFIIVFVSLLNLCLNAANVASNNFAVFRVLRTFRALRPLRALSRFEGMKVVVDALMRAIPSIGHVFLVCVIVWLIFSILGVNLFGGRFGRCVLLKGASGIILPRRNLSDNDSGDLYDQCNPNLTLSLNEEYIPAVRNKSECEECAELMNTTQIQWVIPSINFDNAGHGFLALMQVATFKGWLEIMNNAIDITGIEQQPSYENSFYNYVYFCVFIIFGAFFSLNLFIGVIIDNFNQQKVKCSGGEDGVFLTEEQRRYYNAMKRMASKTPGKPIPRPSSHFANKVYDIVTNRKFEIAVMAMILLNMVVLAVEHYDMSEEMAKVLENINLGFICVFIVEVILKLIGLRLYYFTVAWNVFDFIVILVSIIASALSDMIQQYFVQPTLFRIVRLFRVTRILRLIREAKGIRTLLFALMMSLPALFNIGTLLFLVIFIYAILGMSQFAYVQKIAGINNILNFETFPNSFLVLFQVSTSEGWNTFIEPILRDKPPFCDPTAHDGFGDCGNSGVGIVYFVTFVMITFLIVINMYIAIILENFEVATRESAEPLTADDFEQFFEVWQHYDDRLTQYIAFDQLQHLLHHLDYPLRVPFPNRCFIAHARMRITPSGRIHCLEVIIALIKKVLGDSPELNNFKDSMVQSFMLKCPSKEPPDKEETIDTFEYVRRIRAATIIQKAYRNYRAPKLPEIEDPEQTYLMAEMTSLDFESNPA